MLPQLSSYSGCPADIAKVEILRNNQVIHSAQPGGRSAELTYVDPDPPQGRLYYYVRVTQADNEIGWSSPVWLN